MAEIVNYCRVESPVGTLLLAVAQHGLRVLHFDRGGLSQPEPGENWVESASALRPYTEQLEAYFQGNLREFTVALDLGGTALPDKMLAGSSPHSVRRNPLVWRTGPRCRKPASLPRCRPGQSQKPGGHHRSLPSRDRRRWQPNRLRRRHKGQRISA